MKYLTWTPSGKTLQTCKNWESNNEMNILWIKGTSKW